MAGKGSYAKGVAKREEILRTALEVFAKQGYRGTSLRELAEAVNLSQAETDNSAALAAAAKVLPNSLLNYLSPPS